MNKTKLEVIRINEDVIATSGVCQHQDKNHYVILENYGDSHFYVCVFDANNKKRSVTVFPKTDFPGAQPNVYILYYKDGSENKICEGSHDYLGSYTDSTN